MLNLLSNAIKFTPGGATVTCRIESRQDGLLALRIEDMGPGIPPDQIERVLEPFGQSRSTDGDLPRGTGLGLPITKKLVEALGHSFLLESTLGKGTTATVLLPIDR